MARTACFLVITRTTQMKHRFVHLSICLFWLKTTKYGVSIVNSLFSGHHANHSNEAPVCRSMYLSFLVQNHEVRREHRELSVFLVITRELLKSRTGSYIDVLSPTVWNCEIRREHRDHRTESMDLRGGRNRTTHWIDSPTDNAWDIRVISVVFLKPKLMLYVREGTRLFRCYGTIYNASVAPKAVHNC